MSYELWLIIVIIFIALVYDFINGMNDAANSIATVVSTRVLTPGIAVLWAAFFNFAAVFLFGTKVASTIGKGTIDPEIVTPWVILGAELGAIIWGYLCTRLGLPISMSHTLIGGLIGPALLRGGINALVMSGIIKILIFIVVSPIFGMILAYFLMILVYWLFRKSTPRKADRIFRMGQLVSSAAYSLGHGANDAQKTAGVIAILLFSAGMLGEGFYVPKWVLFLSYFAMGMGTLIGGWRVVKRLGVDLTHLKPMGGFCAEIASATTLFGTGIAGIPVSTTHSITGSIMGVGVTKGISAVRWGIAGNIVAAWIFTIPATAGMSALIYWILSLFVE